MTYSGWSMPEVWNPPGWTGGTAKAAPTATERAHADVVVIGSHTHGWLSHGSVGSVEVEILGDADFAVLAVK